MHLHVVCGSPKKNTVENWKMKKMLILVQKARSLFKKQSRVQKIFSFKSIVQYIYSIYCSTRKYRILNTKSWQYFFNFFKEYFKQNILACSQTEVENFVVEFLDEYWLKRFGHFKLLPKKLKYPFRKLKKYQKDIFILDYIFRVQQRNRTIIFLI